MTQTSGRCKFKDTELIGIPVRVVVGRGVSETGTVEIGLRRNGSARNSVEMGKSIDQIRSLIKSLYDEIGADKANE